MFTPVPDHRQHLAAVAVDHVDVGDPSDGLGGQGAEQGQGGERGQGQALKRGTTGFHESSRKWMELTETNGVAKRG
jgi:hypothetical protein